VIPALVKYPGIRRRIAAGLIDLCLLAVAISIVTWFGLVLQGPAPESSRELFDGISRLWLGVFMPVTLLVVLVLTAFFWTALMATPGQLLMGCRVARARNDRPLNLVVALWRSFLLVALGGPVAIPLISVFFDRRRRGIHDWLSSSVVVLEDESQIRLDEWMRKIA